MRSLSFLILFALELAALIEVGGLIGAGFTVLLVFATSVLGINLLRQQGFRTMLKLQQRMAAGEQPAEEVIESMMVGIGAMLLILPGFITDTVGLFLMLPLFRSWAIDRLTGSQYWQKRNHGANVYNSEFHEVHDGQPRQNDAQRMIEGEYHRKD